RGPVLDAVLVAPAAGPLPELGGRLVRGVVGEPDPLHGHGAVTAAIRSPISAQPGPAWRWTRNSRLPSGPRIGEAMTSRVPSPSPDATSTIRSRTARWASGPRTTPLSVPPFPTSNWGLTR